MITFTIDLEDPSEQYEPDGRYVIMARKILDICSEYESRATFFIVGRIATAAPQLIKEIAVRGHEIAYHSHAHVPLNEEDPVRFKRESLADKDLLEQLSGKQVIGFRAPRFSLTSKSLWALDILRDCGFRYSSSIMPTGFSLYGFTNAPRLPFRWSNGLIELPLPVTRYTRVPYLGGIYLYLMPAAVTRYAVSKANEDEVLWTYTHPYDFDRDAKFARMPHTPLWVSWILHLGRIQAEKKLRALLALGSAAPFNERIMDISE